MVVSVSCCQDRLSSECVRLGAVKLLDGSVDEADASMAAWSVNTGHPVQWKHADLIGCLPIRSGLVQLVLQYQVGWRSLAA